MNLGEKGWRGVEWIQLTADRVRWGGGCCEYDDKPSGSGATELVRFHAEARGWMDTRTNERTNERHLCIETQKEKFALCYA
jgi:hypothetical protein